MKLKWRNWGVTTWPGNIRELSNVIEQAVILGESQLWLPSQGIDEDLHIQDNSIMDMKDMEKVHIAKALKRTNGKDWRTQRSSYYFRTQTNNSHPEDEKTWYHQCK